MKITTMIQLGRTLGVPGSRSLCLWSQLEWDLPCLPLQLSSTLQLADLTLWWLVDHFLSGENGGDWKSTSLVRRFPQRGWQGRWSQTLWSKWTASVWSEWHVWVISITDILIWSSVILTTIRMMVILVIMVISMPVMVIRMICMYAGDHSASDQHHGDQGNTVYAGDQRHLWQVAPQRVRLHQHSASTHLCIVIIDQWGFVITVITKLLLQVQCTK